MRSGDENGFDFDGDHEGRGQVARPSPTIEDLSTIEELQTAAPAYRPPVQPPHGWEGRTPKHFPPSDKATIPGEFGVKVVGLSFQVRYPRNLRALKSLAEDGEAPELVLRRNPENTYDANAIEVRGIRPNGSESMIGHLPAGLAARIAPELDAGAGWRVTGYEVLVSAGHEDKPGLSIDLRRFDA